MNRFCMTSLLVALCSILLCVNNLEAKSLHHFGRSHGHSGSVKLHHEEPQAAPEQDNDINDSNDSNDVVDRENKPPAGLIQDQEIDGSPIDAVKLARSKVANKISRCTPRPQQQKQDSCGASCSKQTTKQPRLECDSCDVTTSCTEGCPTTCPTTTERCTTPDACIKCGTKCSTTEKSCGECNPTTCSTGCGSGYYCPTQSCWLPPEALVKSSDPPTPATKWIQGDLLIEKCKATNEYNCLKIQFASQLGVASIDGWSLCGGNSGKSDGHIIQYIVLYRNPTTEQWTTFQEGASCSPKVFCVDESLEGPTIHMLDKPVIAQELMLCPLEVTGRHPLLHVRVKGCLLKKHCPVPQTKPPTNAPCCASEEVWLDKDDQLKECMFRSNAGGHAGDAIYSRCGYTFPNLPANIDDNKKYYLEVTFKNPKIIKSLKIMGATIGDVQGTIQRFKVAYKDQKNNCAWVFVREENCDSDKIFGTKQLHNYASGYYKASRLPMNPFVVTTGLRIFPQSWCGDRPVLKLDIKACDLKKQDSCCDDDSECRSLDGPLAEDTDSDVEDQINSAQCLDDLNSLSDELAANEALPGNHQQLLARLDSSEEIKTLIEDLKAPGYGSPLDLDLDASKFVLDSSEADLEHSDFEKMGKAKDDAYEQSEIKKRDDSNILLKDFKGKKQRRKRERFARKKVVKREVMEGEGTNFREDLLVNPKQYAVDADMKNLLQDIHQPIDAKQAVKQ